jgi:hypothetical protein
MIVGTLAMIVTLGKVHVGVLLAPVIQIERHIDLIGIADGIGASLIVAAQKKVVHKADYFRRNACAAHLSIGQINSHLIGWCESCERIGALRYIAQRKDTDALHRRRRDLAIDIVTQVPEHKSLLCESRHRGKFSAVVVNKVFFDNVQPLLHSQNDSVR